MVCSPELFYHSTLRVPYAAVLAQCDEPFFFFERRPGPVPAPPDDVGDRTWRDVMAANLASAIGLPSWPRAILWKRVGRPRIEEEYHDALYECLRQVTLRADQGATMESRFSCECFIDEAGRRMQKSNIFLCIHLKKTLCLGSQALCLDSWALKFFKEKLMSQQKN